MFFLLLRSFLFKIVVVSFLIYLHIRRAYFHMCLTTTENRHPFREWLSLCTLLTYGSLYVRSLPILWMCVQGFRDVFMNKSNYSRPVFRKYVYNTVIHWIRMDWYAARIRSVLGGIHWNSQFIASTFNFLCAHALTFSLSLSHSLSVSSILKATSCRSYNMNSTHELYYDVFVISFSFNNSIHYSCLESDCTLNAASTAFDEDMKRKTANTK